MSNKAWFNLVACFIGGMFCFVFECTPIDNTLGGLRLFWEAATAGAIVAIIISAIVIRRLTGYESLLDFCCVVFCMVIGLGLISASAASFINRKYSPPTRYGLRVAVIGKGHSSGHKGSPECYLFILTKNGEERVQVPPELWETINSQPTIKLSLIPGYLGFPYVVEIPSQ